MDMRERVRASPAFAKPLRIPERPLPGVNLVGFLEAESGLGEVARRLTKALEATEIALAPISYRRTPSPRRCRSELALADDAPYDTNLICLNADQLAQFTADVGSEFFANRYSIGVWFWETNVFRSEDRAAARFLDEIWVASDYVRQSIERATQVPVHVVPIPVGPLEGPFLSRSALDLADAYTFLFLFDFVSADRKNPGAVVEAFTRAFEPREGPALVLKSMNGRERKPRQLTALIEQAQGRDDILVRDGYCSARERDSYIAACDCYVSLHRSEGFGLTLAEAMACRKPVIATGYSGNLAFMDEENSLLVPFKLVDVPEGWWAHEHGALWADPDVETAADLMRCVYENRTEAATRGERGGADIGRHLAPSRAASFMTGRLEASHTTHGVRTSLAQAAAVLNAGIGAALKDDQRRLSPLASARRVLRRVLWPQLEAQHRFDTAMADALSAVQRTLYDIETRRPNHGGIAGDSGDPPTAPTDLT